MTLNNMAVLCGSQGKHAEAEALYRRSISLFEKALGRRHPKVAAARANYASLLRTMKRGAEGKTRRQRCSKKKPPGRS